MREDHPKFQQVLDALLEDGVIYHNSLAESLSQISGKANVVETLAILSTLIETSGDDDRLSKSVNDLFMMVKLSFSDEVAFNKNRINYLIDTRHQELLDEERTSFERARLYREYKSKDVAEFFKYVEQHYDAEHTKSTEIVKSLKDQKLCLIDKILQDTALDFSEAELKIKKDLEFRHGLVIDYKGWLIKSYRFRDKKLAEAERKKIVEDN
jgi:hypothetical protein